MDFGLAFGIWDYEWVLDNVPPHVLTTWRARYLIEPWDMENRMTLAKIKYEPPEFIQDLIKAEKKKHPPRRRMMTSAEFRRKLGKR